MTIRQSIDSQHHALDYLIRSFRERLTGTARTALLTDEEAVEIQRQFLVALTEFVQEQQRFVDFHMGKTPEPKQHFAEAVIVGRGSTGR